MVIKWKKEKKKKTNGEKLFLLSEKWWNVYLNGNELKENIRLSWNIDDNLSTCKT